MLRRTVFALLLPVAAQAFRPYVSMATGAKTIVITGKILFSESLCLPLGHIVESSIQHKGSILSVCMEVKSSGSRPCFEHKWPAVRDNTVTSWA
jgi:hypothetical protein